MGQPRGGRRYLAVKELALRWSAEPCGGARIFAVKRGALRCFWRPCGIRGCLAVSPPTMRYPCLFTAKLLRFAVNGQSLRWMAKLCGHPLALPQGKRRSRRARKLCGGRADLAAGGGALRGRLGRGRG